ncbi:MAG: glutathione peroxidase, partial [Bacteroidales bacterium]|nr:glutathione peroxidase [Bacteroidales bacterium]
MKTENTIAQTANRERSDEKNLSAPHTSVYDFNVKTIDGKDKSLADYKGKVLLIVNSATHCGFTPQYNGLQLLYEKYKNQGFEILDFPCNQFAKQAPENNEEIHSFCTLRYKITFTQFAKIDVNGVNESPLYTFLKKQKHGILGNNIKWNFTKFLIDRNGTVIDRFASMKKPQKLEAKIRTLL